MRTLIPLSTLGAVLLLGVAASAVVTIDWVPISNAGNAPDTESGYGAVPYAYFIGKYEVTNAQYAEFLNAVAATDTNGLYNPSMGSGFGGITQSGSSGSFSYTAIAGRGDMPVNFVSFYDSLRFANWLHNGQPTGARDNTTTEDGAYTFSGATSVGARNAGATIFLTSEDEWYKAAYYNALSSSYFDYPAGSNTQTTCNAPTAAANSANCDAGTANDDATDADVDDTTNVGSFTGSPSPYGTFDQGGNVYEWNEAIISSNRGLRGGSFSLPGGLAAFIRPYAAPTAEPNFLGFRVASLPEPATVVIDWTFVGDPGNACDPQSQGCFGAVGTGYNIGTYEVTNAQYVEFLTAVASNDIHGLYSPEMGEMGSGLGGIAQTCATGGGAPCTYSVIAGRGDMPVNWLNFYNALRFANWLHNGQPTGAQDATTTEDGAYTFSSQNVVGPRNAGATVFLPSEDEWYKAAYYDPLSTSYNPYPFADGFNGAACEVPVGTTSHSANCDYAVGDLTNKGSYTGSSSPYGTFDQGGNVFEWNETTISSSYRGLSGGAFNSFFTFDLAASSRSFTLPVHQDNRLGFRVAPEPGRNLLLVAGVLGVFGLGWRRGRRAH